MYSFTEERIAVYKAAIKYAIKALRFYGDIKYSHKWGVPCEAQWVAEEAIRLLESLVKET